MKSMVKIVCCAVALAWMHGASAEEDSLASAADTQMAGATSGAAGTTAAAGGGAAPTAAPPDDVVVPTPPAPRITVKPYRDKVDRAKVEKRLGDKSVRTQKRTAEAEKDASERAAKAQAGQ